MHELPCQSLMVASKWSDVEFPTIRAVLVAIFPLYEILGLMLMVRGVAACTERGIETIITNASNKAIFLI